MISLLRLIISIVITVGAVLFALANRDPVALAWSPVHDPLLIPVGVIGLGGILIGFILGGLMVWLNGGTVRRERRKQRRLIKKLERELEDIKTEKPATPIQTIADIPSIETKTL